MNAAALPPAIDPAVAAAVPGARLVAGPAEVDAAFARLAAAVQPLVDRGDCVLLGVLLGGMVPLVRLAGLLAGDFTLDACRVSRYGHETRGGQAEWLLPPRAELAGRRIVIVDDIFDEGHTLAFVAERCRAVGAADVRSVVLVRKRHDRAIAGFAPDHSGLVVGDEYVFGCGMDYRGRWRHLPAIHAVPG